LVGQFWSVVVNKNHIGNDEDLKSGNNDEDLTDGNDEDLRIGKVEDLKRGNYLSSDRTPLKTLSVNANQVPRKRKRLVIPDDTDDDAEEKKEEDDQNREDRENRENMTDAATSQHPRRRTTIGNIYERDRQMFRFLD